MSEESRSMLASLFAFFGGFLEAIAFMHRMDFGNWGTQGEFAGPLIFGLVLSLVSFVISHTRNPETW